MHRKTTQWILLIAVGLLMAADAGAVTLTGTTTVATHGPFEEGVFQSVLSDTAPPAFSADFSALGDTPVTATWQAPAGQFIQIEVPAGFAEAELRIRLQTEGGFNSATSVEATGLSTFVTDTTGDTLPAPVDLFFAGSGSDSTEPNIVAAARFNLNPGETYRFSSFNLTGTMPAGYDRVFTNAGYNSFEFEGTAIDPTQTLPDPGTWITLVRESVPSSVHYQIERVDDHTVVFTGSGSLDAAPGFDVKYLVFESSSSQTSDPSIPPTGNPGFGGTLFGTTGPYNLDSMYLNFPSPVSLSAGDGPEGVGGFSTTDFGFTVAPVGTTGNIIAFNDIGSGGTLESVIVGTYEIVPEPASAALLALGGLVLTHLRTTRAIFQRKSRQH